MPGFDKQKIYYFNHVQDFVKKYHLKRAFKKLRGIHIDHFDHPIEDVILIRKLMAHKFSDYFWTVTYVPELDKVMVVINK